MMIHRGLARNHTRTQRAVRGRQRALSALIPFKHCNTPLTPTPQQIRSETYKLDRVVENAAPWGLFPDDIKLIKAISAKWNKAANHLPTTPPPVPYKLKLGYVAAANEVKLVKQIGCNFARVQRWPGSAQEMVTNSDGEIIIDGAFTHGIEVSIRIAREYIPTGTSKALVPLTTDALRSAMIAQINADLQIYKARGVKSIILGNEPDGTKNGQQRYWNGAIDRFGTDWARHIAPLVRSAGIRVGFGLPIYASATPAFVGNLVSSGAYQPGDFFAANIYGGTAADHHIRREGHVAALESSVPTFNPDTDFEISEAGLQRAGPADAWVDEFGRVVEMYRANKFAGSVSIYRIDENYEAPFAPFKDGVKTGTFDKWKAMTA